MTKPTDPLTLKEVQTAAAHFFELFEEVLDQAPPNTSIEDALKFSETIFAYAHTLRSVEAREGTAPFGFNKKEQ